jgi:prolyl oligopeptidase
MSDATNVLKYPPTRRGDQVDDYHGTKVADPFRWLEDLDSQETADWVASQNAITQPFLAAIPGRDAIRDRLKQLMDYPKRGLPWRVGKRYFWYANTGLQNQSVLYTASRPTVKNPRVLIDSNTLSADGTVALGGISMSEDGNLMAYSLSTSGSDWQEWHVRNIETGADLPDVVKWSKFSGASWLPDNSGFFYSRYDEPKGGNEHEDANYNQKLYFHRLGTPQSEDVLIYERPDHKDWGFGGSVTEDGRYLLISVWTGSSTKNRLFYRDLKQTNAPVVELFADEDARYDFIANDGTVFWIQTDLSAPLGRVVAVDVSKFTGGKPELTEVIPQSAETLQGVGLLDNKFVVSYLKDAHTQVKIFALDGSLVREVQFPLLGTVGGFGGKRRQRITYYSVTSYATPGTIYRYDVRSGKSELFYSPKVKFSPDDYTTEQVFYQSKDGTRIPMFISYRKGMKRDGNNPTILYGYGGFDISLTPAFSTSTLVWMEMGGVYAVANLRGGGEYGEHWHLDGTKAKKQNVFDDFIAAAEYLIANKYTSTPKLAINGGSNGGLLVGACLTQRPDLFACAVPQVGVLDMLRFHLFTIGWAWKSDYGCSDDPEEFKALYAYSPLHNIKPGTHYPATLVMTADHDDRVVPAHSFKFISTLQAAQTGSAPVLIRVETKAGHGAGKPTTKWIEEAADEFAFILKALDALPEQH